MVFESVLWESISAAWARMGAVHRIVQILCRDSNGLEELLFKTAVGAHYWIEFVN